MIRHDSTGLAVRDAARELYVYTGRVIPSLNVYVYILGFRGRYIFIKNLSLSILATA